MIFDAVLVVAQNIYVFFHVKHLNIEPIYVLSFLTPFAPWSPQGAFLSQPHLFLCPATISLCDVSGYPYSVIAAFTDNVCALYCQLMVIDVFARLLM